MCRYVMDTLNTNSKDMSGLGLGKFSANVETPHGVIAGVVHRF